MRAAGVRAPAEHQPADDQLIAVDDRRRHASAVRRPHAELFGERAFPQQLAVAAQGHQEAVAADGEDVSGRGIDDGRGPGDPVRRDVAREDVVPVFPEELAGVGVEAHQTLLHLCALARGVLEVEVIAKDHGPGAPAVRRLPRQVLACWRPGRDEVGLGRDAGVRRPAPVRPVCPAQQGRCRDEHAKGYEQWKSGKRHGTSRIMLNAEC